MKKQINCEEYENNYLYFNSREKILKYYSLKDHYLTLCFEDINLNSYKTISVFIKNIKTREIFKCISKIEDNSLIIDLKSLNYLCTNYEFSIIIILDDYTCSTAIYPKIRLNKNNENSIIFSSDNSNIQWFLRVLDNGKLRLSTIYLFSNLDEDINKVIL